MKAVFTALALAVLTPSLVSAHAVVYPARSAPGAYERYVLRVPNEKDVPTTRVEITFPSGVRVISFAEVQGWKLAVRRDTADEIVSAAWTGTLQPERFVELPFVAVNPRRRGAIVWPTYQTYADGERVAWTGVPDSNQPASRTIIDNERADSPDYVGWAALATGILALGVAVVSRK
jgi:uncharacterized protein YcnI